MSLATTFALSSHFEPTSTNTTSPINASAIKNNGVRSLSMSLEIDQARPGAVGPLELERPPVGEEHELQGLVRSERVRLGVGELIDKLALVLHRFVIHIEGPGANQSELEFPHALVLVGRDRGQTNSRQGRHDQLSVVPARGAKVRLQLEARI